MNLRALIVDDEPFVRADLRHLLAKHPKVEIVAEAGTLEDAASTLANRQLDVVFLDIQLRGCDGFDIVPLIRPGTEIIFVTAFDRYAVRAFEVNALDYLLKPILPDRLALALGRLELRLTGALPTPSQSIGLERADRVLLKTDSERRFVHVNRIAAIMSLGGNYTEVQLTDCSECPAVRQPLKEWERVLPASSFVRVHRNAIVNLTAIRLIERDDQEGCLVWVHGGKKPIVVSRRALADFNRALNADGTGTQAP